MVIDMQADGVEVRPLKMPSGNSEFNEVFFNDVFVPDDDVVGPVDGGWTVARATLGNESVSIGGGQGGMSLPGQALIPPFDAHPERLPGGSGRVGRYIATSQAMTLMNLRTAHRAVAGGGPGPEGNVTKLVLSEIGHEAAAILAELTGPDAAFLDRAGLHDRHDGADAPGHVDRRRHVGDQAQPDRRAHPRPPPRPAHQLRSEGSGWRCAGGGAFSRGARMARASSKGRPCGRHGGVMRAVPAENRSWALACASRRG